MDDDDVARCIACRKKPPNPAKLGGKRYCYNRACYDLGVERGHIIPQGGSKRARAGAAASASGAPLPQQMGRTSPPPEMPPMGVASIYKIHALYGFRRVPRNPRAACSR